MKSLILIVTSDPQSIGVAQKVLSEDYDLIIKRSGQEALQAFEEHLMQVQMVILDTTLQDMDPQDWIDGIKKHHLLPYIILLCGDVTADWMVEAMKAGAADILCKQPFYDSEMALAVRQGFEYKNVMRYMKRANEFAKTESIQRRLAAFLNFMNTRKSQSLPITPSEIALYFPAGNLEEELPLDTVISATISGKALDVIKQWKERPTLLIVEDEDSIRDILYSEFGREFHTILAASCEDALHKIEDEPEIDMAILDVGLPGMSGDDFVPILKKKYPKIQLLMLTGYPEHRLIVKTLSRGAGDYIVKPFRNTTLRQRVYGLLQSSILNRVLAKYMRSDG